MAAGGSPKSVIYAALAGNLLIALTKFGAAFVSGSSAMLSEGVHSLVDTGNQILLLYGIHRAAQPPDGDHPLGYGRELYFWSFIVALLIFSLGAGISIYEGITHIQHPVHISNPLVNYIVLGLSAIFEGITWAIAFREFNRQRGTLGPLEAVTRSKDPTSFIVMFEDSAAMLGIAIAFAGTFAAEQLEMPLLDGMASIGIGAVLGFTALFLARESKSLLIGEPARRSVRESILQTVRSEVGVDSTGALLTVHLAPDQIVAAVEVDFDDEKSAADVERIVDTMENRVRDEHPEIVAIFIKPKAVAASAEPREGRSAPARQDGR